MKKLVPFDPAVFAYGERVTILKWGIPGLVQAFYSENGRYMVTAMRCEMPAEEAAKHKGAIVFLELLPEEMKPL